MNNNTLPPALAPYVTRCLKPLSLTLLTSVLDTPVNWLLVRFVAASLRASSTPNSQSVNRDAGPGSTRIIFLSVWRSFELWSDLLRKQSVDLQKVVTEKSLIYVDGLASGTTRSPALGTGYINLKSLTSYDLRNTVTQALSVGSTTVPTTIIIDGLDLLLATSTEPSATEFLSWLTSLQSHPETSSIILTASADSPLLHNIDPGSTPLEIEHSTLARGIAYQSNFVFSCRPLESGRSRDATGIIRVSRGGHYKMNGNDEELGDAEWLYHAKGDGTVRVWSRGE